MHASVQSPDEATWMAAALREARLGQAEGEVPVGAVVVLDGRVIGAGHNTTEDRDDPSGHAEINALRAAGEAFGDWRLEKSTLVVTLEPCTMCTGAMVNARLGHLVYGATDPKAGASGSVFDITGSTDAMEALVLAGVPTFVKGLTSVSGLPNRFGSKAMPDTPAEANSPTVDQSSRRRETTELAVFHEALGDCAGN